MTRRMILYASLVIVALAGVPLTAQAAVNVNIGIDLPGPPRLVAVPTSPVMYAPAVQSNYFFFDGRYWVFTHGAWYRARGFNGPWVGVAPRFVPAPILNVPVRYYHVRPREWRHARHDGPPPWAHAWGRRGHGARGDWHPGEPGHGGHGRGRHGD